MTRRYRIISASTSGPIVHEDPTVSAEENRAAREFFNVSVQSPDDLTPAQRAARNSVATVITIGFGGVAAGFPGIGGASGPTCRELLNDVTVGKISRGSVPAIDMETLNRLALNAGRDELIEAVIWAAQEIETLRGKL